MAQAASASQARRMPASVSAPDVAPSAERRPAARVDSRRDRARSTASTGSEKRPARAWRTNSRPIAVVRAAAAAAIEAARAGSRVRPPASRPGAWSPRGRGGAGVERARIGRAPPTEQSTRTARSHDRLSPGARSRDGSTVMSMPGWRARSSVTSSTAAAKGASRGPGPWRASRLPSLHSTLTARAKTECTRPPGSEVSSRRATWALRRTRSPARPVTGARLLRGRDAVGLELAVEVAALDAQALGGAGHVPLVGSQLAQDERALEGLARLLERALALGVLGGRLRVAGTERRGQILRRDDVVRAHDHEPLHHVAQLAHVARPVVGEEVGERLDRDRLGPLAVLGREHGHEVCDEGRQVLLPLTERRHLDRDDVQAVVEILPEPARRDALGQVLVGGGEDTDVHPDGVLAPHPLEGLLLESAQHLGLGLEAHVADLVKEEGALIGQLELAAPPRHRAGERAALVPEQLGLDQLLRDRRAVHLDEGPVAPRGERVDGAGHQLLARAVLALDEHAPARGRRDRDLLAQVLDERALAHDLLAALELGPQVAVLPLELGGLVRGLDGSVAGDHDHRGLRTHALHLGEGLEPVDAGHPDVEKDDVGCLLLDPGDRLLPRAHRGDPISFVF